MKFDHYGVPTTEDREGAGFHPVLRLNFSSSVNPLFRIEYLKFHDDCIFSKESPRLVILASQLAALMRRLKLWTAAFCIQKSRSAPRLRSAMSRSKT